MVRIVYAVTPILSMVPPDPVSVRPSDIMELTRLGWHLRDLGEEQFYVLYKLMTMSSADFLDEWFENQPLKATLSASGIIVTFLGLRSPGTAYVLLHHYWVTCPGAGRGYQTARR